MENPDLDDVKELLMACGFSAHHRWRELRFDRLTPEEHVQLKELLCKLLLEE